jgi:hypothetical protein
MRKGTTEINNEFKYEIDSADSRLTSQDEEQHFVGCGSHPA